MRKTSRNHPFPGERDIIRKISNIIHEPLNDDCAYLRSGGTYLAFTIDSITEEKHIPEGARPEDIGWYAVGISLSDLAASGADPLIGVISLVVPGKLKSIIPKLMQGAYTCATRYSMRLVGGDTKEGPHLVLTTASLGRTSSPISRSGAHPGESIYLTGRVGRCISGFYGKRKPAARDVLRIHPRCDLAGFIRRHASACIDLSDGLVTSLYHISEASKCRLQIDLASIPLDESMLGATKRMNPTDRVRLAMNFGGDYELLFTSEDDLPETVKGVSITRIGEVTPGKGVVDLRGKPIPDYGYEHFSHRWVGKSIPFSHVKQ